MSTYSTLILTTTSDCDTLISLATKDKNDLNLRKLIMEKQRENYAGSTMDIDTELQLVNAQISAYQVIVNALPEGTERNKQIGKLKTLEAQQFILTNRKNSYGAIALLQKEQDLAIVEKEIAEADTFIAAITARKAQL